jgi:hypothetical protein
VKAVLLRVGIDSGTGGIHGPLLADGTFEYVPIPDGLGVDGRTYGTMTGVRGKSLVEYFPVARRDRMRVAPVHVDPEFESNTYGDPARGPKAGLRHLESGDLLIFYCGLEGYGHDSPPALYLLGYFEVQIAGLARELGDEFVRREFAANFHVRHSAVYEEQHERLVLAKGTAASKRLTRAVCISAVGRDVRGAPLKILSPAMQSVFGTLGGRLSLQRSTPRWIEPGYVPRAAAFLRSLP